MSNKKHKVNIDLINSMNVITDMLIENRKLSDLSFEQRPKSPKDSVPNDPYWTPFNCYLYAQNRFYREWPSGEAVIKEDPKAAVYYAINVLDGPWPDDENGRYAENKISTDPSLALYYAKMVKGRWEKIEPSMATKPEWAYEYAKTVLEHQWDGPYAEDAEAVISNDPYTATLYCMDLKKPKRYDNPLTERRILDSIYGSLYAHTVAPDLTIQDLNDEVNYRLEVLHTGQDIDFTNVVEESKWDPNLKHPEPDVRTSSARVMVHYAIDHLKRRWPEAEPYILKNIGIEHNDRDYLYYYALLVIRPYDKENPDYDRGRWLEAEPFIAVDPHVAYGYARDILMERWKSPEVELGIINSGSAKYYAEYVAETSEDELREDIENKLNDLHYHDSIDLKDTIEEAIDNLLPLIVEALVERDYSTMTPTTVYAYAITDYKTKQLHGEDYEPDPKAEAVMMRDPGAAYYYARDVINDGKCLGKRWEEAEPTIMSEPYWAYAYAKDVLGRRWKTAENVIKNNTYIAYLYARYIIKPSNQADYDHDNGRWDIETESRILEDHDPVIPENDSEKESEICELYANNVAEMTIEDLKSDIEKKLNDLNSSDDTDLTDIDEAKKKLLPLITESRREDEKRAMALFHIALDKKNARAEGLTPKQESEILKSPEYAYKYAQYVIEGEWVEAEPIILTDQYWAFNYAKNVIKGTWKAAEPLILGGKDLRFALSYATDISKIRLAPMVELRIIEHFEDDDVDDYGYYLYAYCAEVAKMSVKDLKADAEMQISELTSGDDIDLSSTIDESIDRLMPLISENEKEPKPDPSKMTLEEIFDYLNKSEKHDKRWPEAEPYIMKNPKYAFDYAYDVINKEKNLGIRWPEAEPYIMKSPRYAHSYAYNVINKRKDHGKRWPEAEPYIMKSSETAFDYAYYVINKEKDLGKRWPEAEPFIKTSPEYAYKYARYVINKGKGLGIRWPEAEPYIIQDESYCYQYATYVALMPHEKFLADVKYTLMRDLHPQEDKDFTGIDESIDRLMPLIAEGLLPDPKKLTPQECYNYAYNFILKMEQDSKCAQWLNDAEEIIKHDPDYATAYAKNVLNYEPIKKADRKKRFISAEEYIMKSPKWAYIYARDIYSKSGQRDKLRWEDAEPFILQDPKYAYFYAQYVAHMPLEVIQADVDKKMGQMFPDENKDLSNTTDEAIDRLKPIIAENEEDLPDFEKMSPINAFNYVFIRSFNKDKSRKMRCPEAERAIIKDPHVASLYAQFIMGERWYLAEPLIIKDLGRAKVYADKLVKMPFNTFLDEVKSTSKLLNNDDEIDLSETTDEAIVRLLPLIENKVDPEDYDINRRDALECYTTARFVIKKRWPKAEPKILTHPYASYLYANYVLDRPWKQAEPIISTDAKSSLFYAQYVLKRRWPEGEMAIKQDPEYAYYYAEDVIKPFDKDNPRYDNGRWEDPKTELLILNAPWEMPYAENVAVMTREDLLAEIELKIKDIVPHDDKDLTGTTDEAINRLMPLIKEDDDKALPDPSSMSPTEAFEYVYEVVNHGQFLGIRWEEAEPIIAKNPELAYYYATTVINNEKRYKYKHPGIRNKVLENGIKDHPKWAYYYALEIINQGERNGIRWFEAEPAIILNRFTATMYSKNIADMPVDDFITEVENRQAGLLPSDDKDLTGTTDEAIDRLIPLINETSRKDYWGRRKEFKEYYPISNWLDKAINKIRARFFGSYPPKFQQSIIALKAKADEYRKKGADNFKIGADLFSYKKPYPPKEVLDDRAIPSSIKSLLIGAFHDEEEKLNKDYENSLKDTWEHEWPAPEHKKQENIQYDLRRRLRGEAIAAREHLKKFKDTTADDDLNLSDIDEE